MVIGMTENSSVTNELEVQGMDWHRLHAEGADRKHEVDTSKEALLNILNRYEVVSGGTDTADDSGLARCVTIDPNVLELVRAILPKDQGGSKQDDGLFSCCNAASPEYQTFLARLKQRLQDQMRREKCGQWTPPAHDRMFASRGGWAPYLIKLYQMVAAVIDSPPAGCVTTAEVVDSKTPREGVAAGKAEDKEEQEEEASTAAGDSDPVSSDTATLDSANIAELDSTRLTRVTTSSSRATSSGAAAGSAATGSRAVVGSGAGGGSGEPLIFHNLYEAQSLWTAMHALQQPPTEEFVCAKEIVREGRMGSSTPRGKKSSNSKKGKAAAAATAAAVLPARSATTRIVVALQTGAWKAVDENEEQSIQIPVSYDEASNRLVVMMDLDYLSFCLSAYGRYDAYMWALLACAFEPYCSSSGATSIVKDSPSLVAALPGILLGSFQMCRRRAGHALRVFRDATHTCRVSEERFGWYLTLLTSGGGDAIADTLKDIDTDLWHAQFCKDDIHSRKRLEQLLVALLGHPDASVRSEAAAQLNGFYDAHDWQRKVPFLPVISHVGMPFCLEFVIVDTADPVTLPQGPEGVYVVLSAPSWNDSVPHEVFTYHKPVWTPLSSSGGNRGAGGGAGADAAADTEGPVKRSIGGGSSRLEVHTSSKSADLFRSMGQRYAGPRQMSNARNPDPNSLAAATHKWVGKLYFGNLPRCGYFDWRVVRAEETTGTWETLQVTLSQMARCSSSSLLTSSHADLEGLSPGGRHNLAAGQDIYNDATRSYPLQGRVIVQKRGLESEQIHEVFVDQHGAKWDSSTGQLANRGNFATVAASLEKLGASGITSVYLLGALARDNGGVLYTNRGEVLFERPDASPFAVTCRASPNAMLGGPRGFSELMREAHRNDMSVLVDCPARVASARPHRKYAQHFLRYADCDGKLKVLYGTEGRGVEFEDSCLLNYRSVATWDMLVEDVKKWALVHQADGVRLDNAESWPPVLRSDSKELGRRDCDHL
eukprot:GHVU01069865.1.p1 GENE.GHVU01069865.1~~GHVU01069865.1.p1  ORF type:complete len:995 (-),score=230.83 GHVU01069865.1:8-2992(-)